MNNMKPNRANRQSLISIILEKVSVFALLLTASLSTIQLCAADSFNDHGFRLEEDIKAPSIRCRLQKAEWAFEKNKNTYDVIAGCTWAHEAYQSKNDSISSLRITINLTWVHDDASDNPGHIHEHVEIEHHWTYGFHHPPDGGGFTYSGDIHAYSAVDPIMHSTYFGSPLGWKLESFDGRIYDYDTKGSTKWGVNLNAPLADAFVPFTLREEIIREFQEYQYVPDPPSIGYPAWKFNYDNPENVTLVFLLDVDEKPCKEWEFLARVNYLKQAEPILWEDIESSPFRTQTRYENGQCSGTQVIALGGGIHRIKVKAEKSNGLVTGNSDWVPFTVQGDFSKLGKQALSKSPSPGAALGAKVMRETDTSSQKAPVTADEPVMKRQYKLVRPVINYPGPYTVFSAPASFNVRATLVSGEEVRYGLSQSGQEDPVIRSKSKFENLERGRYCVYVAYHPNGPVSDCVPFFVWSKP